MYFQWQYPTKFEPVSTDPETPGLDKWYQPLSEPVLPPEELAEHQSFFVPVFIEQNLESWGPVYPDLIHDIPEPPQFQIVLNPEPIPEAVPDLQHPVYPDFIHEAPVPVQTPIVASTEPIENPVPEQTYPVYPDFIFDFPEVTHTQTFVLVEVTPDQWTPIYPDIIHDFPLSPTTPIVSSTEPIAQPVPALAHPLYSDTVVDFPIPVQTPISETIEILVAPDQWTPIYPDLLLPVPDTLHTRAISIIEPIAQPVPEQFTPVLDLPPADIPRLQYLYPSLFIDADISSIPEVVAIGEDPAVGFKRTNPAGPGGTTLGW